jgi:hypothetical protein
MGVGPVYAIPKLLAKVGIRKDDVEIFQINKAFAYMVGHLTPSPLFPICELIETPAGLLHGHA